MAIRGGAEGKGQGPHLYSLCDSYISLAHRGQGRRMAPHPRASWTTHGWNRPADDPAVRQRDALLRPARRTASSSARTHVAPAVWDAAGVLREPCFVSLSLSLALFFCSLPCLFILLFLLLFFS